MRRSGRYTFIARTSKEKTEQKETTEIRFNENNARDDHTGKMTTTEIADIEAWKDDEIINEYGVQFATVWGSSKEASTRQIYDNMVLEGLHTARASTRTGNLLQGNPNDIGFRRGQLWPRTSR